MRRALSIRDRLAEGVAANLLGRPAQLVFELTASVLVARHLGPELLAILVAIRALANVASAIGDMGITSSISKIVPDLATLHGRTEALRAARRLTVLRMVAVPTIGLVIFLMTRAGVLDIGQIELTWAMVCAALVLGVFTVVNGTRRYVILAALRLRDILIVDVLASVVGPAVNIAAAVLTRDPLTVALSTLLTEAAVFAALHFWLRYDLDESDADGERALSFQDLLRRYGVFAAMAYAKFVFNRVVLRNPMLLLILGLMNATPAEIGNAAIALSLAFQAWQVANIPLGQMRSPLLARFHARGDRAGMEKLQALSVASVTVTSCGLAAAAMAGAAPIVAAVYGDAYADAARMAGIACAVGLVANVFSLGNSTLQQFENYRVQVIAMAVAFAGLMAALLVVHGGGVRVEPALTALLLIVGARSLFWILTDAWADRSLFGWAHAGVKLRGVACAIATVTLARPLQPDGIGAGLLASMVAAALFMGLFRLSGGVGPETRALLRSVLPARVARLADCV